MRRKIMIPLIMPGLVFPLLGGCISSEHLVVSKPADPSAIEEITSLRENTPNYTTHRAATAKPEIYGSPSTNNSTCTSGQKSCVPSTSGTTC